MQIGGLVKSSLVDYPGRVAAVIFTQGCNFRCPFCHNAELVIPSAFREPLPEEGIIHFLAQRRDVLQGVVITGGEPTLQPDLMDVIKRIKAMGYPVKLDTNGSRPRVLAQLLKQRLLDYVAMDIKASPGYYDQAAGVAVNLGDIRQSIDLILRSGVDYMFRTTLVRSLCPPEAMPELAQLIGDARQYRLQEFVAPENVLDKALLDQRQYSSEEVQELRAQWGRGQSVDGMGQSR